MSSSSYLAGSVHEEPVRSSSIISTASMKNGLKSLAQKYKEHDRNVQAAWEAYYGVGTAAQTQLAYKPASSRNSSSASEESVRRESKPSSFKKVVKAVQRHAKEHHQSVNMAYALTYGDGRVHSQRAAAIQQFDKAY